jgi:hypothetical protein
MYCHSKAFDFLLAMMRSAEDVIRIRNEQQINFIKDHATKIVFNYTDTLEIKISPNIDQITSQLHPHIETKLIKYLLLNSFMISYLLLFQKSKAEMHTK